MKTVTKKVIITNSQLRSKATPQGQRSKRGRLNSKAYHNTKNLVFPITTLIKLDMFL